MAMTFNVLVQVVNGGMSSVPDRWHFETVDGSLRGERWATSDLAEARAKQKAIEAAGWCYAYVVVAREFECELCGPNPTHVTGSPGCPKARQIRVDQHIPGFVDAGSNCSFWPSHREGSRPKPHHAEVATFAEVLELGWVKQWASDPTFYRWSLSRDDEGKPGPRGPLPARLMAEMEHGAKWWVVAYVYGIEGHEPLPTWHPPKGEP